MVLENLPERKDFAYWTITLYGLTFQRFGYHFFCNSPELRQQSWKSRNPVHTTPAGYKYVRFRLFPVRSPLLGESRLISIPEGT